MCCNESNLCKAVKGCPRKLRRIKILFTREIPAYLFTYTPSSAACAKCNLDVCAYFANNVVLGGSRGRPANCYVSGVGEALC